MSIKSNSKGNCCCCWLLVEAAAAAIDVVIDLFPITSFTCNLAISAEARVESDEHGGRNLVPGRSAWPSFNMGKWCLNWCLPTTNLAYHGRTDQNSQI